MACTLFTRLFYGTSSHPPTVRPAAPTSTQVVNGANNTRRGRERPSLTKRNSALAKLKSTFNLTMESSPLVSLVAYNLPSWLSLSNIEELVTTIPEIIQVRQRPSLSRLYPTYDLIFDFISGTDAFRAFGVLEAESTIKVDHLELRLYPLPEHFDVKDVCVISCITTEHLVSTALADASNKRVVKLKNHGIMEPQCYICHDKLKGLFSTPCWNCNRAECHDCLKSHFRVALLDFGRFPAKCCDSAIHPDVVKGVLPDEEHTKYKLRFEEWLSKSPVYCPVPTCSAFIPHRLLQGLHNATFSCPGCNTSICKKCKQKHHPGEACTKAGLGEDMLAILKQFGYKQCPKCGTAVGKMFGCSHVQCNCGAHWCWECRRKIEICVINPCDGSYGEGDDMDYDEEASDIDSINDSEDAHMQDQVAANTVTSNVQQAEGAVATPLETTAEDTLPTTATAPTQAPFVDESIAEDVAMQDTAAPEPQYTDPLELIPPSPIMQATDSNPTQPTLTHSTPGTVTPQHSMPSTPPPERITTPTILEPNEKSTTPTEPEFINLDDPNSKNWQYLGFNFGEEPTEEDSLDIWGCLHDFVPALANKVPRHWMTSSIPDWWERPVNTREVNCMVCWRATKITPQPGKSEGETEGDVVSEVEKARKSKDWRFARRCTKCNIVVCRKCRNDMATNHAEL